MNTAIVFAGGSGQRMKSSAKPKQFLELYGKPIIIFTLEIFEHHPQIDSIVVPCIAGWEDYLQNLLNRFNIKKVKKIITGGKDTQESKMNALNWMRAECADNDIVILHDAVRPLITEKLITDTIDSVKEFGSAVSYVPFTETGIISKDKETTNQTIVRNTLCIAKAPQGFYYKDVLDAHTLGETMDPAITIDTCSLMTELGKTLHLVQCESTNIKITSPDDFFIFKALIDLQESKDIFGM